MEDADDGAAPRLGLLDQAQDGFAVRRIEARRRLIEQHHRHRPHETARNVHPLLLAARKRGGRERPEPLRDPQPGEQRRRAGLGIRRIAQRLRHHLDRGNPRHHAQELAHIAHRLAPQRQDFARARARDIHPRDPDLAGGREVISPDHPHHRGFPRPGGPHQPDAFPRRHGKLPPRHHRDDRAALIVQRKRLRHIADLDHLTPAAPRRPAAAYSHAAGRPEPDPSGRIRPPGHLSSPSAGPQAAAPPRDHA